MACELNSYQELLEEEQERLARIDLHRKTLRERLKYLVAEHLPTLSKKRQQAIYIDDYGAVCGLQKWSDELKYFRVQVIERDPIIESICDLIIQEDIRRIIADNSIPDLGMVTGSGFERFHDFVNEEMLSKLGPQTFDVDIEVMAGGEFEVHCAQLLEQEGWTVIRKGGTGDQGVDLVASLGQLRVAVQCKRYSQPVCNKAVQEVAAGRQFEQCDLAVVVSNADYTTSARQLAGALGVMLVHFSELNGLREVVETNFSALISGEAGA